MVEGRDLCDVISPERSSSKEETPVLSEQEMRALLPEEWLNEMKMTGERTGVGMA